MKKIVYKHIFRNKSGLKFFFATVESRKRNERIERMERKNEKTEAKYNFIPYCMPLLSASVFVVISS